METSEAIAILQALADGVDPHIGEVLPPYSPYQSSQVIRALFLALRTLEIQLKTKQSRRPLPENSGKPWAASEDELLCRRFDSGASVTQMAQEHRRTEGAIRARLVRLGKIDARDLADEVAAAESRGPNNSPDLARRSSSPS